MDCETDENICKNQLLPNERFYWSLVLILYFGIPITVVILSYIGLVSSVNEIRQSIIQMGRRSNRDGTEFQKTIICVIGGFILCWAPTIFLQVSQVTGLSGSIFRTKNFCNNFKEFAKERTLVLSTCKNLFKSHHHSKDFNLRISGFKCYSLFIYWLKIQERLDENSWFPAERFEVPRFKSNIIGKNQFSKINEDKSTLILANQK